jgi:hypothetical protein
MLPVVLHWGQSCIQREDGAFSKANCLFAHSTIKPRAYFDCSLRLCRIEFSVHTALPIAQAPAGVRRLQRAWIERKEAEPRDILKSDAFAPFDHSMTSSARARNVGGIFRPSALAALRLTTNSSLVGNSTGKSPGAVPFKILST